MDYIGMFEFDEKEKDDVRHATFMLLVKANDVEDAVGKFKHAIRSLKKSHDTFTDVKEVYMKRIIQVKSFPETPIMTHWESGQIYGEGWASINYEGKGGNYFDSFGFGSEDEGPVEPFVTFGKGKGNGRAGKPLLKLVK